MVSACDFIRLITTPVDSQTTDRKCGSKIKEHWHMVSWDWQRKR